LFRVRIILAAGAPRCKAQEHELARVQLLEHDLAAKVVSTFADHALARVPARWTHLVEKNSRKINCLGMILPQKWFPFLRIMLQA
jgi:hypothetical protein